MEWKGGREEYSNFISWGKRQLDLAQPGYNRAIQYYTVLKNRFIAELYEVQGDISQKYSQQFIENINNEIKNSNSIEQFMPIKDIKQLYEDLLKLAEEVVIRASENGQTQSIKNVRTTTYYTEKLHQEKQYKGGLDGALRHLSADLNNIMSFRSSLVEHSLDNIYQQYFGTFSVNNEIQSGTLGLLKRAILQHLTGNRFTEEIMKAKRLQGYQNQFKGYYSEELKTEILNKSAQALNNKWGARQTGSLLNQKKVQSEYDIIIGKGINQTLPNSALQQYVLLMDNFDQGIKTDAEIELINPAYIPRASYGVQSKLWVLPEQKTKFQDFGWYKIGNRSELLNSIGGGILTYKDVLWERGWHYNIYLLSKYLITVFGQSQVMFGLRNNFIWTAELISHMRNIGSWVSFYYTRNTDKGTFNYPATSELIWDTPRYGYANWRRRARLKKLQNI